jgi:hypothetical protein
MIYMEEFCRWGYISPPTLKNELPRLKYDRQNDELIIIPQKNAQKFICLKKDVFGRHYRQRFLDRKGSEEPGCVGFGYNVESDDSDNNSGFIEVTTISKETVRGHLYLPLTEIYIPHIHGIDLEGWNEVKNGQRCAELELVEGGATSAYFRGIVDLWGPEGSFADMDGYLELRLLASGESKPRAGEEKGWCVMS